MAKKYKKINDNLKSKALELLSIGYTQMKVSERLKISPRSVFLIKNNISKYSNGKTIRVTGVSDSLYKDLEEISKRLNYSKLSQFIRKELFRIRDSNLKK